VVARVPNRVELPTGGFMSLTLFVRFRHEPTLADRHECRRGARAGAPCLEGKMLRYKVITGATPHTLGEVVTLNFGLPNVPRRGTGLLFYMVDTREGDRAYRIDINGNAQSKIALPPGNNFATLHTEVGHLGTANVLQFESEGALGAPVDILNVVLFYED
jgi:hypothetical protein